MRASTSNLVASSSSDSRSNRSRSSPSRHLVALALVAGLAISSASAHGGSHDDDGVNPEGRKGIDYVSYHMAHEHHIDSFDLESFFKLHDLNRDGILDRNELEAIYGLHHETSREKSGTDEEHQRKTDAILKKVLDTLDQNGDGVITKTEFVSAGREGLPEFSDHEGLGHHYDSEGEYFLHHEEMYHNTPETQTEDSYVHPEDIAHFEHHEDIERAEEDRVRKAQGLPPTDPDKPLDEQTEQPDHDEKEAAMFERQRAQRLAEQGMVQDQQQQVFAPDGGASEDADISKEEKARMERSRAAQEQARKLKDQSRQAAERGAWGEGGEGFKKPKDKVDRLRDRIPYKYRVRSSFFGEF